MTSNGRSARRRTIGAIVGLVAAASLLTGCFDRDFGRGELVDINDDGIAVGGVENRTVTVDTANGHQQALPLPIASRYTDPQEVGIDNDGTVFGTVSNDFGEIVGFRWTPATGVTEVLPQADFDWVLVRAVSDGGIVGGLGGRDGVTRPVIWTGDRIVDLGDRPDAPDELTREAWVEAVNDDGQVIGGARSGDTTYNFTWDAATGFRLRPVADGAMSDINEAGVIVGSAFTASGVERPAWYDWATLTSHPIDDRGSLYSLNDQGMAVGRVVRADADGTERSVPVCAELSSGELSELPNGAGKRAVAINDAGAVVGSWMHRAGIWKPGTCAPTG